MSRDGARKLPLELTFDDLKFDEAGMKRLTARCRRKILLAFSLAEMPDSRRYVKYDGTERRAYRKRSTENSFLVFSPDFNELTARILLQLRGSTRLLVLLDVRDVRLSSRRRRSDKEVESALVAMEVEFFRQLVEKMASREGNWEIYYHELDGRWQVGQSSVDEAVLWGRVKPNLTYRDDRSFHGMPRNQVVDRGRPPGASTSEGRQDRIKDRRRLRRSERQQLQMAAYSGRLS